MTTENPETITRIDRFKKCVAWASPIKTFEKCKEGVKSMSFKQIVFSKYTLMALFAIVLVGLLAKFIFAVKARMNKRANKDQSPTIKDKAKYIAIDSKAVMIDGMKVATVSIIHAFSTVRTHFTKPTEKNENGNGNIDENGQNKNTNTNGGGINDIDMQHTVFDPKSKDNSDDSGDDENIDE